MGQRPCWMVSVLPSGGCTLLHNKLCLLYGASSGSSQQPSQEPGKQGESSSGSWWHCHRGKSLCHIKESGLRGTKDDLTYVLISLLQRAEGTLCFEPAVGRSAFWTCYGSILYLGLWFPLSWNRGRSLLFLLGILAFALGRPSQSICSHQMCRGKPHETSPEPDRGGQVQPSVEHLLGLIKLKPVEGRRIEMWYFKKMNINHIIDLSRSFYSLCLGFLDNACCRLLPQ